MDPYVCHSFTISIQRCSFLFCMQEADARKRNLETKEQELVELEQKLHARERVSFLSMLYGKLFP